MQELSKQFRWILQYLTKSLIFKLRFETLAGASKER